MTPRTRILKTDLTWTEARDVQVGDELIAFPENLGGHKHTYQRTQVVAVKRLKKPCVTVHTTKGVITVSSDHRFVARYKSCARKWVRAIDLRLGALIPFLAVPWEPEISRDGGWLAGFLDGEGWVHRTSVGFGQNPGVCLSRATNLLKDRGYRLRANKGYLNVQMEMIGDVGQQLRLLGSLRPVRLLPKADNIWEGRRTWGKSSTPATVLGVYDESSMGDQEVIAIETDCHTFIAEGFFSHNSGIEAIISGYCMGSQRVYRLAFIGIHDYFMCHGILYPNGLITAADLPDLKWSDADLKAHLKVMKNRFKGDDGPMSPRQVSKRVVYLSFYAGTPHKMHEEYPDTFPTRKDATVVQGRLFELLPEIPEWHWRLARQVDKTGYHRCADGFIHRYYRTIDRKPIKDGKRIVEWKESLGDDAKRVIALEPQHLAAKIGKDAMKRVYYDRAGMEMARRINPRWEPVEPDAWSIRHITAHPFLRLFIHDEILCECPVTLADAVDRLLQDCMEVPVQCLPLDPAWSMGTHVTVKTEGKQGTVWSDM